jgi:hypothetical protein
MLRKSFRSFAPVVLPLRNPRKLAAVALAAALVAAAAGCGGSGKTSAGGKRVRGEGYTFRAPADWQVRRRLRIVEAHSGDALVSVTALPLAKAFEPSLWQQAVKEMDSRAAQYAQQAGTTVGRSSTITVAGQQARSYELKNDRRLAFLLVGKREYVLYCRNAGSTCDALFSSFALSAA